MPIFEQILSGLEKTAQSWQWLAAVWHLYVGAIVVALVFGVRPPARIVALLLAPLVLSVGAISWISRNPFNGMIFSLLGAAAVAMASRLSTTESRLSPWQVRVAGALMVVFGWVYPALIETSSWVTFLHSAPIGVIPCPTLAVLTGLLLVLNGLGSRRLSLTLGILGVCYGFMGALLFGIVIDWVLAAGSSALVILVLIGSRKGHFAAAGDGALPVGCRESAEITSWGVGPRLTGITLTFAAIAAFIQFAAGSFGFPAWGRHVVFPILGVGLIAAGAVLWILGFRVIDKAFAEGRLLTTGVFGLVRHPMYSAFTVCVPLGVALLLRSWAFMSVPIVAGLSFLSLIGKEERYLEARFGRTYREYKARVSALVPFLKWPRRRRSSACGAGVKNEPAVGREPLPETPRIDFAELEAITNTSLSRRVDR